MSDFVRAIGAYVNRVERANWRRATPFSQAVLDGIVPLCHAYAAGLGARALYLTASDVAADLRPRTLLQGPRGRAAAALVDNLELALAAWLPYPDRGVRDPYLAAAFRLCEPTDTLDHEPTRAQVPA